MATTCPLSYPFRGFAQTKRCRETHLCSANGAKSSAHVASEVVYVLPLEADTVLARRENYLRQLSVRELVQLYLGVVKKFNSL